VLTKNNWNISVVWNNASKQHTVGYSQSQQVFKVFSIGLHTGPESISPLVDRFVYRHLFKARPHHHWSSAIMPWKLQVVLSSIKLVTCKCGRTDEVQLSLWKITRICAFLMKPCKNVVGSIFRSTPPSRPIKAGLKCLSIRPSTKTFFDFNEILYIGRGRWVMHGGMQYDPI